MSPFFVDSVASTVLWIGVKATVLLGVAALVQTRLYRRSSAATRHFVWTLAIIALLVLPAAVVVLPEWAVVQRTIPAVQPVAGLPDLAVESAPLTIAAVDQAPAGSRSVWLTWPAAALGVYVLGVIAMLMHLIAQQWSARRLSRHAVAIEEREWVSLLAESARSLAVRRPVRLLRSREGTLPLALGIRRPSIVIPVIAETWSDDRRRAVMLHELAHIARFDCLTQTLALIARALYWFHPAAWWVARRLRVERELACDDRVIEAGTEPRDYAGHLLEIAYSVGRHRAPALAVTMAHGNQLEGRMLAALDRGRNRRVPAVPVRLAGGAVSAALMLSLAGAKPTAVVVDMGDARAAEATEPSSAFTRTGEVRLKPDTTNTQDKEPRSSPGVTQDGLPGTWEIRSTKIAGTVHLRLVELNSSTGRNIPIERLEGLTAAMLSGAGGPVQFRLRRDAGTFAFEGVVRNGIGAGTFSFTPDPNFATELAKRGFARPTAREQYEMARHDVGFAFVDELTKQGYAKPETSQLVRAGQHGVDVTYVREMGALGYRLGSLPPLVTLRDHGVTPEYARELGELGYKGLSADDLRRARDHGVGPEYIRGMRDAGYGSLSIDAAINARDHGVTPEFVKELGDAGHRKLPLEQVIRVRDHGVSPEYARELRALGHALPIEELVRARDHGVSVEFARDFAALGYSGVTMDMLIRLRDHGVDPAFAKELKTMGYDRLTLDDLITLRGHGLTADRIRAANKRAGTRLPIDMLKSLAAGGMR
jgi:beta-lactamase regulating signal transducer with metallopeptidase domain